MRYKEAFSLYRRKLQSGKVILYYQLYDDDGERVCGHSTGKSTRTAAREYCNALLREGRLLPKDQMRIPTFAEFAQGWWDFETCGYLKRKLGRRPMTRSYADMSKNRMNKHVIPYFGKMRLDKITNIEIEDRLTSFSEKGVKNETANGIFIVLKIMLGEAARNKIIKHNPCADVEKLMSVRKDVKILTPDEVRGLFPSDRADVWGSFLFYLFNKLAACTGMRIGEIVGLRGERVFDGYIKVCGQFNRYGFTDTNSHLQKCGNYTPASAAECFPVMDSARIIRAFVLSDTPRETQRSG
jgi:predicted NUDIX family phosphoesterase